MASQSTERELRSLRPEAIVHLYEIDMEPTQTLAAQIVIPSNTTYRFVNSKLGDAVRFNSRLYVPWPIVVKGLALKDSGPLPSPTIDITDDEDHFVMDALDGWDPVDALFRHKLVWRRHLDDGSDPNPLAILDTQEYEIHTYTMGTVCQIGLISTMAKFNAEFPRYTVAQAREAI